MTKEQIVDILVDSHQYHLKHIPLNKYHNWAINPIKQGMIEMFTKESLLRILKKEINLLTKYDSYDGDCNYCDDNNCTNGECKDYI